MYLRNADGRRSQAYRPSTGISFAGGDDFLNALCHKPAHKATQDTKANEPSFLTAALSGFIYAWQGGKDGRYTVARAYRRQGPSGRTVLAETKRCPLARASTVVSKAGQRSKSVARLSRMCFGAVRTRLLPAGCGLATCGLINGLNSSHG